MSFQGTTGSCFERGRRPRWPARWAGLGILGFAVALPPSAQAHGELLIRIAGVTRQIEEATNNTASLYLQRGELHREHRDWPAAEADYARAAGLDPKLAAVEFCRAKMLADADQLEAAHAKFDQYLARCPSDGEAFIARARLWIRLGQRQAAVADYRRGLALVRVPQPDYFLELAQAMIAEARPDEALRGLDEGIKRLGPIVTLQSLALDLELERKNHDAALARLDTIVGSAARKEHWLTRRGEILLAAGRPVEARKAFEAALAAISILPRRLQQGPPLMKLQSRINAALAGITNAPAVGKADGKPAPP